MESKETGESEEAEEAIAAEDEDYKEDEEGVAADNEKEETVEEDGEGKLGGGKEVIDDVCNEKRKQSRLSQRKRKRPSYLSDFQ